MKFEPYKGDLIGLPVDGNHLVFRWNNKNCKILFSAAQQGKAISSHFASDKKGLRHVKEAINDWCEFVGEYFEDIDLIFAKVTRKSVLRILLKLDFELIYTLDNKYLLTRRVKWDS